MVRNREELVPFWCHKLRIWETSSRIIQLQLELNLSRFPHERSRAADRSINEMESFWFAWHTWHNLQLPLIMHWLITLYPLIWLVNPLNSLSHFVFSHFFFASLLWVCCIKSEIRKLAKYLIEFITHFWSILSCKLLSVQFYCNSMNFNWTAQGKNRAICSPNECNGPIMTEKLSESVINT